MHTGLGAHWLVLTRTGENRREKPHLCFLAVSQEVLCGGGARSYQLLPSGCNLPMGLGSKIDRWGLNWGRRGGGGRVGRVQTPPPSPIPAASFAQEEVVLGGSQP